MSAYPVAVVELRSTDDHQSRPPTGNVAVARSRLPHSGARKCHLVAASDRRLFHAHQRSESHHRFGMSAKSCATDCRHELRLPLLPSRIAAIPRIPASRDPAKIPSLAMSVRMLVGEGQVGDEERDGEPDAGQRSGADAMCRQELAARRTSPACSSASQANRLIGSSSRPRGLRHAQRYRVGLQAILWH